MMRMNNNLKQEYIEKEEAKKNDGVNLATNNGVNLATNNGVNLATNDGVNLATKKKVSNKTLQNRKKAQQKKKNNIPPKIATANSV